MGSEKSGADAFIARHMAQADTETVAAMREFLEGRSAGQLLRSADEWHAALDAICTSARAQPEQQPYDAPAVISLPVPDCAPSPAALRSCPVHGLASLAPADQEREMRLVRSWLRVGSRVSGQVFLGHGG